MAGQNYRALVVWQKAMDFVFDIYTDTRKFPADERFGLVSQMRRCAISIPSNIAEGQGRGTNPDFVRFLRMSYGSLRELETQILIAQRLAYIADNRVEHLLFSAAVVGKLLNGLMRSKS